jgi:hypothetical protein
MERWQYHRDFVNYSEIPAPADPLTNTPSVPTPKLLSFRNEKENIGSNICPDAAPKFTKNLEFKPFNRRESAGASSGFSLASQFNRTGQATPLEMPPMKRKQTDLSTLDTSTVTRDKYAQPAPVSKPPTATASSSALQSKLSEQGPKQEQPRAPPARPPAELSIRQIGNPFTNSGFRNESIELYPHTPSAQKSKSKPLLALCTPQTLLFPSSVKENEELYEFSLSSHPSDEFEEKFYIKKKDSIMISDRKNEQRILSYEERLVGPAVTSWKRGEVGGLRELADRSVGRAKIQVKRADPMK